MEEKKRSNTGAPPQQILGHRKRRIMEGHGAVGLPVLVADAPVVAATVLGRLRVDLARRQVWASERLVELTPTEYDLLRLLVQNAGRVLTHRQMLRQVWGAAYESESHLLRVNISNLRRKIEPDPNRPVYLITEPGVGYRLKY